MVWIGVGVGIGVLVVVILGMIDRVRKGGSNSKILFTTEGENNSATSVYEEPVTRVYADPLYTEDVHYDLSTTSSSGAAIYDNESMLSYSDETMYDNASIPFQDGHYPEYAFAKRLK